MGIWSWILGSGEAPPSTARDPLNSFWYSRTGLGTAAGQRVTIEAARTVPLVRDCLQVLSSTVGSLSFGIFQRAGDTDRRRVDQHPIMKLLHNPNPRTTAFDFMVTLTDDLAASGFFLGELVDLVGGFPTRIDRIDPGVVILEELLDHSLRFVINEPGRPQRFLLEADVWYIPVPPCVGSYRGRSTILDDGREAIGAMMGMHDFANRYWSNDATPPFVFRHERNFKDAASKDNFLAAWRRRLTGAKRGGPGVLEYGMTVEKLGSENDKSQFIETRSALGLDITRLWRMQPHKVGILADATYSNIEQQSLEFVIDTMLPWLRLIERSIDKRLIGIDSGFYFQFSVASLLRGDMKARFDSYAKARQWGWISVNEIRAFENMNSIGPAGERYIEPLNMVPVGAERDDGAGDGENAGAVYSPARAMAVLHGTVGRAAIKRSTGAGIEGDIGDGDWHGDGKGLRLVA